MKNANGIFRYDGAAMLTGNVMTQFFSVVLTKPLRVLEETQPLPSRKRFKVRA
jgi:hypothetical protein